MKTTIDTSDFINKLKIGSESLAIYSKGVSLNYKELAAKLSRLKNEFDSKCPGASGGILVLHFSCRYKMILTLLALMEGWQKIILVSGKQNRENLHQIASKYKAKTIVSDILISREEHQFLDGFTVFSSGECLAKTSDSVDHSVFKVGISLATELLLLPDQSANPFSMTMADLIDNIRHLDKAILPSGCDSYLFYGDTDCLPLIQESFWALHKGLQLLYIEDDKELKHFMEIHQSFAMDFGLFFFGSYTGEQSAADSYQWLLEMIRQADREGFAAIWTPERHFNQFGGLFPNPSVLSAAIAASTEKIRIRCGSIVSPLHHSVRIAEDWSLIDNLSNGRVGVSFASGWQCNDFIFSPEKYKDRHATMLQQITEVRQLWEGERLELRNGLGQNVPVEIYPKPVQEKLPVWVTVSGKTETFIDAGKIGANILTHLLWQDTDDLIEKISSYRKSLKESGYDPEAFTVSVMAHTFLGSDEESVREIVREPLKSYIKSSVHLIETMTGDTKSQEEKGHVGRYGDVKEKVSEEHLEELLELAFDRFFEQAGLLGSPEKCHRFLEKLRSYDVDEVACLVDFGVSPEDMNRSFLNLSAFRKDYERHPVFEGKAIAFRCGSEKIITSDLKTEDEFAGKLKLMIMESEVLTDEEGPSQISLKYDFRQESSKTLTVEKPATDKKVKTLSEAIDEEF